MRYKVEVEYSPVSRPTLRSVNISEVEATDPDDVIARVRAVFRDKCDVRIVRVERA